MISTTYPIWSCPKKLEAREQTIIETYRHLFNRSSIPTNTQYWTMSGAYFNKNKKIEGECQQLVSAGLIKNKQYRGVDINKTIVFNNRKHYPNLKWYNGDFIETMRQENKSGRFNPAIINLDNVRQISTGIKNLISALMFLDYNVEGPLMLINNLMLNSPYRKTFIDSGDDMLSALFNNPYYKISDDWNILPAYYKYNGSGIRAKTYMGSIILYKK
jgi:hypothetical protein